MRYRAGWLIQGQILALTHFVPVVSQEDFMNITANTNDALQEVSQEFHVLIDNRIILDLSVVSLEALLNAAPIFSHPELRSIVIILPEAIKDKASSMEVQQNGLVQLKFVDSLHTAYQHLIAVDDSINWGAKDPSFFIGS